MKKLLLISITFLALSQTLNAQSVGIGTTTPDGSAILDISSTDQGVLVPRMSSANRQNILDPAKGLMVYDTTASAFYYFTGNGWLELLSGSLDRITDTDGDTKIQVEESADEDVIRFDLGGTEYFRLDSGRIEVLNTGASVYIGTEVGGNDNFLGNQNIGVGYRALKNTNTGQDNVGIGAFALTSNTNGFQNIALGYQALYSNTTGNDNIGIGYSTLHKTTTGYNNGAIGYSVLHHNIDGHNNFGLANFALNSNTSGDYNYAVGNFALQENTTGSFNNAFGNNALRGNVKGSYNSAFGNYADVLSDSLTYATAIGANALVGCSDCLVLGDTASVNVGIGTATPDARLHVVGQMKYQDGNAMSGRVLTSDANGNATWQSPGIAKVIADTDGDTKIQVEESPDEDQIRFDINGQQAMWLGANGNLNLKGLSTVTNLALFKDSTHYSSNVIFQGSGTQYQIGTPNADRLRIWNSTNGEIMSILPNGNVGVRVAGPQANFHVNGSMRSRSLVLADTTRTALILKTDDNAADMGLAYRNNGGNFNWNIYRSDAGSGAAHLIIAGGPQQTNVENLPERMRIMNDGRIAIGTAAPATGYLLSVGGKMIAEELKIRLQANWPDYVFDESYKRMSFQELQDFIEVHNHLPNIPSAAEIAEDDGIEVGEMQRLMMEKIEELTLYVLELKEEIDELKKND